MTYRPHIADPYTVRLTGSIKPLQDSSDLYMTYRPHLADPYTVRLTGSIKPLQDSSDF